MQQKNFMVVMLPTNDHITYGNPHTDYDEAFDNFNQLVSTYTDQLFDRPRSEKPLRASVTDGDIELWVVTRTTDLITR